MTLSDTKVRKLWGGFESGRLSLVEVDMGWGGYGTGDMVTIPAIFKSRKEARKKFQDVRPIRAMLAANGKENGK